MKSWVKIAVIAPIVVTVLGAVGAVKIYGQSAVLSPQARALTSRTFERTPARLERGKYLVEAVLTCNHCHSPNDWTKHDAPIPPGMELAGQDMGSDPAIGHVIAPNLTPDPETGAGKWTDDMLARSIREGIGHDGRALFSLMPYRVYRHLPDEDLASIVVYLRSLPPAKNPLPKTQLIAPVYAATQNDPQPVTEPVPAPDLSTPLKRGTYLVSVIGCVECHTPIDDHAKLIHGMEFGGGQVFEGPGEEWPARI